MTSGATERHTSDHAEFRPTSREEKNQSYARLGYLLGYFALASCGPYYSLLLGSKDMSSRWIGVIMTAKPLSVLFILPPVAHFADRHHNAGRVLAVCGVLSCAALVLLTAVPMNLIMLSSLMVLHFGAICTFTSFFDDRVLSTLTAAQKADWGSTRCFGGIGWGIMAPVASILVGISGWWMMGVLYTVFYVASMWCYQRLVPCPVTTSLAEPPKAGLRHDGLMPASPTKEPATDVTADDMLPIALIDAEMGYSAARRATDAAQGTGGELREGEDHLPTDVMAAAHTDHSVVVAAPSVAPEASFAHIVKLICTRRRLVLVLIVQCIGGVGYTLIATYLFLFLGTLNPPAWLYGLAVTMTVVVEIPLFRVSDRLHARLSDSQMLVMALVGWSLRVIGYSLLPASAPYLVLLLEPLHGLSFGFLWLSGVHCVTRAFPSAFAGSSIGFLNAATFGVGPVVGNLAGGWLYGGVGPRAMFGVGGLVMLVVAAAYALLDRMWAAQGYTVVIGEEESRVVERAES